MTNQTTRKVRVASLTLTETISLTHQNATIIADEIISPKSGTLSTRTSNTVGTLTLTNGHGITSNTTDLMLSWLDEDTGRRQVIQVTVGTVSGTSVPITKTRGPVSLPPAATPVTLAPGHTYSTANLVFKQLFITCSCDMLFECLNDDDEAISSNLVKGNRIFRWDSLDGSEASALIDQPITANDFVHTIPNVRVYNLDTYNAVIPNFKFIVCGEAQT